MMGLDGALALFAVIATSVLQPLVQPPVIYWLLGVELNLPLGQLMFRLAMFVGAGAGHADAVVGAPAPEFAARLANSGSGEPYVTTPGEFTARIKGDYEKYGKLIRSIGVKVE